MSARPRHLTAVLGTATEVGKTWVSAAVLTNLRESGWTVAARKPLQSAEPGDTLDADVLATATGEKPDTVCAPESTLMIPMAPPMAAEVLNATIGSTAELTAALGASWGPRAKDIGLIETVGGPRSPMSADGDSRDVAAAAEPDSVVLVCDASLGTINATLLCADAMLEVLPGARLMVFVNRFDGSQLARLNIEYLGQQGLDLTTDVAELAAWLICDLPEHCGGCGDVVTDGHTSCRNVLDPDHYCARCGRRLKVNVSPTSVKARCPEHGPKSV